MSEMVERCARAICASDFEGDTSVFDTMSEAMRENFYINARAAIDVLEQTVERAFKDGIRVGTRDVDPELAWLSSRVRSSLKGDDE